MKTFRFLSFLLSLFCFIAVVDDADVAVAAAVCFLHAYNYVMSAQIGVRVHDSTMRTQIIKVWMAV